MSWSSGLYLRQASLPLHLPKDIRRKRLKLYTIPSLLFKVFFFNLRSPVYATQAAYGAQASYPVKTSQIGSQMNEKRENCNLYNRLTIYVFHAIVETAAT